MSVIETIEKLGVLPVINVTEMETALPLMQALIDGGIPAIEVTLRTDISLDVIKAIRQKSPDVTILAGTILSVEQVKEAIKAGAQGVVLPGYDQEIVDYALENNIPIVAGGVTPAEIQNGIKHGLSLFKFFPSEPNGGVEALKLLAAPFGNVKFLPTGGINMNNIGVYLKNDFILAVGGEFMATPEMLENRDFALITENCKKAVKIATEARNLKTDKKETKNIIKPQNKSTKAVLVTGVILGNGGFVIAERFAKEGYTVFVTARNQDSADEAAKELENKYGVFSKGYCLDLRNDESIHNVFKDIDSFDCFLESVCFNAADLALGPDPAAGTKFFETTPDYLRYILEANVVGNFNIAQQTALRMKEHGGGALVFIGSNSAIRPNPNRVAYIASKGGIHSMSKALAVDLGPFGIRSNVVSVGTIKTKRWVSMGNRQITNGTMTPIGDISDFEDVANAVYFLGTEQSKNITGTELVVDGGMTCQLYPEILNKYRAEDIAKGDKE